MVSAGTCVEISKNLMRFACIFGSTLERAARAVRGKHDCSRGKNSSEADFDETRSQNRHAGHQASQPTIQSAGWRTPDARPEGCPGFAQRRRAVPCSLLDVGAGFRGWSVNPAI